MPRRRLTRSGWISESRCQSSPPRSPACDVHARGSTVGASGYRRQAVPGRESQQEAALKLIPEIVDETLLQFLDAIDDGRFPLLRQGEDSSVAAVREPGQSEMPGRPAGGDSTREYFRERRHKYLRLVEPEDT